MSEPATAALVPPASTYRHVAVWALVGTATTAVGVWLGTPWPPTRVGASWILALLLAASATLTATRIAVPLGRGTESEQTLSEAAVLPAVVLLHPGWAILVAAGGELISEVAVRRKHPLKVVFNVSWTSVATGAASMAFLAVWDGDLTAWTMPAAAIVATAAYTAVDLLALYLLATAVTGRGVREVAGDNLRQDLYHSAASASVGTVAAVLLVTAPWILPLLGVPLLFARTRAQVRRRYEGELLEERDRFDRTIAGASDGIVLVGRDDTVRVWNSAAEGVTGRAADAAVGQPLPEQLALLDLGGEPIDIEALLRDGRDAYGTESWHAVVPTTGRTVTISISPDASGHELVLVLRDISQQQELDRMREDLVSRVSHELRTPLATTTGFLETALGRWEELPDDKRRDLLLTAHRSSRRLNRVVAGLLVRSRIEAAAATPRPDIVDVVDTVDAVLEELSDTITLPAAVVDVRGEREAYVDRDHLVEVIENLVVNADRYGAGRVDIAVLDTQDTVILEIRDHGDGIDPDFVPSLFDAFSQASVGLRRTAEGLGLGLSIVRALVEANGGRVSYDDAPGGGAAFLVRLPRPVTDNPDVEVNAAALG